MPASLLLLARGRGELAVASAVAVNALSILRGLLGGISTERAMVHHWRELVDATKRYGVAELRARDDMQSVPALLDAVASRAVFDASTVPSLLANGSGLALTLVTVVVLLGSEWLLLGAAVVAVALPVIWLGQRRLGREHKEAFFQFNASATAFEVLLEGAAELRVHAVERRHVTRLMHHVRSMAAAERRATATSVMMGLLPMGLALLVAVVPLRERLRDAAPSVMQLADVGILGATALALAVGLMRSLQGYARTLPFRRMSRQFLDGAPAPASPGTAAIDVRNDELTIAEVSHTHAGSQVATPHAVSFVWSSADGGLALRGDNGSGKTTLAMCLVGLVHPSAGEVRWGGVAGQDVDWEQARRAIVFVPQHGYVSPRETIAWHLRLLAHGDPEDAELREALSAVDLTHVLERGGSVDPLEVLVSELSGGERKRMHLARALIGDPALVVLDEPEAGLDAKSRVWLRDFAERLARDRRVLLVAHDASVVPSSFRLLSCVRSQETATPEG